MLVVLCSMLQAFQQLITTYQQTYDEVLDLGQSLYQMSHPRAEPILYAQLQHLEGKWLALRNKVGMFVTRSQCHQHF